MGFVKQWTLSLVTVQIALHTAKTFTTESCYALFSRLIDVAYLQFGMLFCSWFYLTKRLNLFSLKVNSQIRSCFKVGFVVVASAAHFAFLFFYLDLFLEDSWVIYLCFLSVAFYIHLILLTFGFFLIEQLLNCVLPNRFQLSIFALSTFNTLVALVLAASLTAYCTAATRELPTVKSVDIHIDDLPQQFNGFTIALLTDVHIGPTVTSKRVSDIVDIVNNLNADSIAISGDLIDGFLENIRNKSQPLKRLRSKHGTFYATGNHEYYHGNINSLVDFLQNELNIIVLHNEHALIVRNNTSICFAGVDDLQSNVLSYSDHKMDAEKALSGCPTKNSVVVMLVHQPNAAQKILRSTKRNIDLILSGHTHSGQFYVLLPVAYFLNAFFHGLYRDVETNAQIYVSAGVNYWGSSTKIKGLCEIILFRLHS